MRALSLFNWFLVKVLFAKQVLINQFMEPFLKMIEPSGKKALLKSPFKEPF